MKVLYEKLDIQVETQKLVEHLNDVVLKVGPPVIQGAKIGLDYFGGWSVYSSNGRYDDGFEIGTTKTHQVEYRTPTEICTGYLKEVMDRFEALGLRPSHARITFVEPRSESVKHRDSNPGTYMPRLHVPIITWPGVLHWTEDGEFHMDADNSVFVIRTDNMHSIVNKSDHRRYHLIMDVVDTKGITKHFNLENWNG